MQWNLKLSFCQSGFNNLSHRQETKSISRSATNDFIISRLSVLQTEYDVQQKAVIKTQLFTDKVEENSLRKEKGGKCGKSV